VEGAELAIFASCAGLRGDIRIGDPDGGRQGAGGHNGRKQIFHHGHFFALPTKIQSVRILLDLGPSSLRRIVVEVSRDAAYVGKPSRLASAAAAGPTYWHAPLSIAVGLSSKRIASP
jgi:hypothetical protein